MDKRHFTLVHSRTCQLPIHAQLSYFGEDVNGKGLSASLHNENESARETYLCVNELSTLCWNFTAVVTAFFLPVQQQLPIALSRLPTGPFCERWTVLTALASPRSGWEHGPHPAGSQPGLSQATGPSCAQVKQISGFPRVHLAISIPQESPWLSAAKPCKYFRLETGANKEGRIAIQCSTELTISCQEKPELR